MALPASVLTEVLRILDEPPAARDQALAAICARNPAHEQEIRRLAEAAEQENTASWPSGPGRQQPATFGPYRILSLLGRGGMGAVYLAEQREPVPRRVALKIIRRDLGIDPHAMLGRFEAERAALARMEHSNIAKVFDAGLCDGQPYFAMEYVKGIAITRYCDENRLAVEERLRLFLQVCSGVQHAHNKGVIHRDLTPNNILVTVQDGEPSVRIIDFGLAKGTHSALTDKTVFTQQGAALGTPAYMSPEQAGLGGLDIDTRSDVYTLGVLLYELLTGGLPFEGKELQAANDPYRVIREQDPPRPSTRITTVKGGPELAARLRRTETRSLMERLRSDLDWIVLKCLEKDRTRRYVTPSALAEDVSRHLAHEPVLARAPTFGYRLRKVLRRHRTAIAASGAIVVSLCVGLGLAWRSWQETVAQKAATEKLAQALASKVRDFDLLAGVAKLSALQERVMQVYPAIPPRKAEFSAWLAQARDLVAMREQVRRFLANQGEDSPSSHFLRKELSGLPQAIDEFEVTAMADVQRDLDWIERVERLSPSGQAAAAWEQARVEIVRGNGITANTSYAEARIDLKPQLGLVPIGMNPVTKLWEFYHLRSAADPHALPRHGADGSITVTADTGIVFVLLPGGRFAMGAQRADPTAPNYDPEATDLEGPVQEIELRPFFVARHELTQGQWARLWTTDNPSYYTMGLEQHGVTPDGAYPVDSVNSLQVAELLARHQLQLPTEAQWEYAVRAGSSTPWCAGAEPSALAKFANLADAALDALRRGFICEAWSDGHATPAPVGRLRANTFGLHDVHGNLAEWVRDSGVSYSQPVVDTDGLRGDPESEEHRVLRGGAMTSRAVDARSSARHRETRAGNSPAYGVRVVRPLIRD